MLTQMFGFSDVNVFCFLGNLNYPDHNNFVYVKLAAMTAHAFQFIQHCVELY